MNTDMNIAMILAGGVGQRMGVEIPKQFIEINDKPIVVYTLEKFENHPDIDFIEIVCIDSYIEKMEHFIKKYGFKKTKWIIPGGDSFQESVCNGVFFLRDKCKEDDIVLIHMSVAPFIEGDIISDSISVCLENGNAVSANPCLLCMGFKTSENYSDEGILREKLVGLNTPQSFRFKDLFDSYKIAVEENFLDEIEPHTTSLMYRLGKRLHLSKGSQTNIKITTKEDLDLFKGYILIKQQKAKTFKKEDINYD